ncbi:MAG: hypothetical protein AMXMBFR37_12540 [Steroidobacteraceae bacterium]|nr:hypothetical protein [Steroidobacteraceae bacterium]
MLEIPDHSTLTRVILEDGCCCELARLDGVLERICAALESVPADQRREVGRALLGMAVAYIGNHGAAALPSRDTGA